MLVKVALSRDTRGKIATMRSQGLEKVMGSDNVRSGARASKDRKYVWQAWGVAVTGTTTSSGCKTLIRSERRDTLRDIILQTS